MIHLTHCISKGIIYPATYNQDRKITLRYFALFLCIKLSKPSMYFILIGPIYEFRRATSYVLNRHTWLVVTLLDVSSLRTKKLSPTSPHCDVEEAGRGRSREGGASFRSQEPACLRPLASVPPRCSLSRPNARCFLALILAPVTDPWGQDWPLLRAAALEAQAACGLPLTLLLGDKKDRFSALVRS